MTAELIERPYWWEDAPPEATGDAAPEDVDVAIVGAGYAGLAAALELARAGASVAVFDAGALGEGASTRNGGLVAGTLEIPAGVARRLGPRRVAAMRAEAEAARAHLRDLVERAGVADAWAQPGRFLAAHSPAARAGLDAQAEALAQRGRPVRRIAPSAQGAVIASERYHGGLVVADAAAVHPAKLHAGLRRAARAAGAALVAETPVHAIARETHGAALLHGRGETWAREVVVATGGNGDGLCRWRRGRIVPVASYMIATAPLAPERAEALSPYGLTFVDTKRLPAYFRLAPDGRRLLFGGRASLTGAAPAAVAPRLRRAMLGVFPQLGDVAVTHAWGGRITFTRDRLPHLAWHRGVLHVAGCQGSGVAMAAWLGHQAARSLLAGTTSAFAEPRLEPVPLYAGRPWFVPLIGGWCRLRDAIESRARPTKDASAL